MNSIKATWKNGQIIPDAPGPWHEGSRLVVHEEPLEDIDFMTETEQADDPVSIENWIAELRATPPLSLTPEQESEMLRWRQKVKEYNLEAMRRRMQEGIP